MATQNATFEWVAKLARIALIVSLVFLALAAMGTIAGALVAAIDGQGWIIVSLWILEAFAAITLAVWAVVLYGVVMTLVSNEHAVAGAAGRLGRAETILENQADSIRKLVEMASLSEQAKSLIYRDTEIEAFRETIHEDIMRQDYKTAEFLIDAMEKKLGYADEAARLREEITASRQRTLEEKIDAAVARITEIIDRYDWARAFREAHRLLRLFPENPKIASLPEQVSRARNVHKRGLLEAYSEAVKKNDVDRGIDLLKELDAYLTSQEAAALEESARGVFKTKLHNLGVQFAILVSDEQWSDALTTGRQIIDEFPNSKMAHEVREKLELLRSKASQIIGEPE